MEIVKELLNFKFNGKEFGFIAERIITAETEVSLSKNVQAVKKVRNQHTNVSVSSSPPDANIIYRKFVNNALKGIYHLRHEFSSKQHLRKLALSLGFYEGNQQSICNGPHLSLALELIKERFSNRWIISIFSTLLENWLNLTSENKEALMNFLKKRIDAYNGKSQIINNIRNRADYYFRKEGPSILAANLVRNNRQITKLSEYLNIHDSITSFSYFSELIEFYTINILRTNPENKNEVIVNILEFLIKFKGLEAPKKCITLIVCAVKNVADFELRNTLKSKTMQLIGDPVNDFRWQPWRGANKTDIDNIKLARNILNEWINHEIVELFFNKLVMDNDRKRFWLRYYRKADNVKIFCHYTWRNRLLIDDRIKNYPDRIGLLEYGGVDQSALVFIVKDYVLVEFSIKGTAFYAYKSGSKFCPTTNSRSLRKHELIKPDHMSPLLRKEGWYYSDLKAEGKLSHYPGWQNCFDYWIKNFVGITHD